MFYSLLETIKKSVDFQREISQHKSSIKESKLNAAISITIATELRKFVKGKYKKVGMCR
jgi:hypothetical protein